jgi:tRNA pseudouridine38-40 synthase
MKRYAVSISYVGSKYSGWASQSFLPHSDTVCGMVDEALNRMVGEKSHNGAIVSSRTDAGVHALYNTFHVDIERSPRSSKTSMATVKPFEGRDIIGGLNAHLRLLGSDNDIVLLGATMVDPERFHARFSAKSREYVYRIIPCSSLSGSKTNSCAFHPVVRDGVPAVPIFELNRAWCMEKQDKLDVEAMKKASRHFLGTHDFTSFRGPDCVAKSPIREVTDIQVEVTKSRGPSFDNLVYPETSIITVRIRAPRFLHRMVRNIVGTIVTVGRGQLDTDDVLSIIGAKDRTIAPLCAPAHGLYLTHVEYDHSSYSETGFLRG